MAVPIDKCARERKRRLRHAAKKLREARRRLARAERSIAFWTRALNDIKYETTRAVQLPLIAETGRLGAIFALAPGLENNTEREAKM